MTALSVEHGSGDITDTWEEWPPWNGVDADIYVPPRKRR